MTLSKFIVPFVLLLNVGCTEPPADEAAPRAPQTPAVVTGAPQADVPEPDAETRRLFDEVMQYAREENLYERPVGEIMQAVGRQFMGTPYAAGILDEPGREVLVCSLNGFDCVTFVETALAMARTIQEQDYSYEAFARNIMNTRYRGGFMEGYCSRIHYFSEWIADNEGRGTVRNVTEEIGGVPLEKELDFMSEHRQSYPRFAQDDSLYRCIQQMEQGIAGLELYYVPQDRIRSVYDRLQAGDVIAAATDLGGLDVVHTGLVHENDDGSIGFLHASTSGGVKVSPDLQDYVQGVDKQIGIIVARPVDRVGNAPAVGG